MTPGFPLIDRKVVEPLAAGEKPVRGSPAALATRTVPSVLHDLRKGAETFVPTPGLVEAVNVALAVGAPLLLTGAPGTGKTQVAYWLWWYFQVERGVESPGQPFTLQVKSTTEARDLLYHFDTVAYFRGEKDGAARDVQAGPTRVVDEPGAADWRAAKRKYIEPGPLWKAFECVKAGEPAIVLIDEIDKAPRDFPNDLLHELDQYGFRILETDEPFDFRVAGPDPQNPGKKVFRLPPPPLVVITSNSERRLPKPFLRRCIFHHLELDDTTLLRAVRRRGAVLRVEEVLQDAALVHFKKLKDREDLNHTPSPGELFAWLAVLEAAGVKGAELPETLGIEALPYLGVLLKDRDDLQRFQPRER